MYIPNLSFEKLPLNYRIRIGFFCLSEYEPIYVDNIKKLNIYMNIQLDILFLKKCYCYSKNSIYILVVVESIFSNQCYRNREKRCTLPVYFIGCSIVILFTLGLCKKPAPNRLLSPSMVTTCRWGIWSVMKRLKKILNTDGLIFISELLYFLG